MNTPCRIQLRRTKGWRMPPNTVKVDRSTHWGNPYMGHGHDPDRAYLANLYREHIQRPEQAHLRSAAYHELRGHNLACWCPLCDQHQDGKPAGIHCPDCAPCHADVLLEVANYGATD